MEKNAHYNLDSDKIVKTVETLSRRIEERFPGSGLGKVSRELLDISRLAGRRSAEMARSHALIRFLTGLLIMIIVAVVIISIVSLLNLPAGKYGSLEIIQAMEAGINNLVFIGAAIFFLITVETRIKRTRIMKALHELRSVAHVIDMHQLTKDPEQILKRGRDTPSSPKRTMSAFELSRYLDYCTELFAM
ncbi:MAG: hypothetical protein JW808_10960, partial [Victivallales bacterium]|nr:hypothetical protein [Victivallales bacterium]